MVLIIGLVAYNTPAGRLLWVAWVALVGGIGGLVTFLAGSIPIADGETAAVIVMTATLVALWAFIGVVMHKAIRHKGPRPLSQ